MRITLHDNVFDAAKLYLVDNQIAVTPKKTIELSVLNNLYIPNVVES